MFLSLVAAVALNQGLADPAAAFGAMPLLDDVEISPNGEIFAARLNTGEARGLGVFTIDGSFKILNFLGEEDQTQIRKFFWKRDDRLVFSIEGPEERYGTPTTETRLYSLEVGGKEMTPLFSKTVGVGGLPVQIQDDIVSTLSGDPDHILVQYRPRNETGEGVYKVQIDRKRRHTTVERPRIGAYNWIAGPSGEARAVYAIRNETNRTLHIKTPDGKWKDISDRIDPEGPNFRILGFPRDRTIAYVASDHETETRALYTYNIETDTFGEMLFSHPVSDVFAIRRAPKTGEVIGVVYAEESPIVQWFESNYQQKTTAQVRQSVPDERLSFMGTNSSGTAAVLLGSDGVRPGRYYVYDYEDDVIKAMPSQYPALSKIDLGAVVATRYTARDGLKIPAFVTLPPGYDSIGQAKNLPFMIIPHGGPTARDYAGFDWLAQFFAHQGYGVLQMNFRGSSGYGEEFKAAGDREWGQAMQDDISDGAAWLISRGYADKDKMAILGVSYGGYAALMGAVKTPDLFQCAVSINGVVDLPRVIKDARDYIGGSLSTRHIGRLWGDRRMLNTNSPLRRVDDITVPVLLIHGEEDRVVPFDHSRDMDRAMRRAGKDVKLVKLDNGSHFLDVNDNRITALREIDAFVKGRCF
ncbi:MAG: prolyl oligopeptidase family serine peptidase [Pseudomonadota bacterium]